MRGMTNKLGASLLFGLSVLGSAGCASLITMTPDSTVPFVVGEIEVAPGDGANKSFTVHVQHLGDPGKLDASATTYVVWIKTTKEDAVPTNMGALDVDASQTGKVNFSTPFKEFEVTVTPESASDASKPSGHDVLKASVDLD
jgi:hypothetical protein